MKTHDILEDLEKWLEEKIDQNKSLSNITSSSYMLAYKSVMFKLDELKDKHE